jgi:hypothetical protein
MFEPLPEAKDDQSGTFKEFSTMIEKVPPGTRMCALFTHRSVANSGKSTGGATEIHGQQRDLQQQNCQESNSLFSQFPSKGATT